MLSKYCVVFFPILVLSDASLWSDFVDWEEFKEKHNKHYNSFTDEIHHFRNFVEHKHKIDAHNLHHRNGVSHFEMGVNKYSDLDFEEYIEYLNGHKSSDGLEVGYGDSLDSDINFDLPKSVDWRDKGALTAVKDQEMCGSCYSFAATGAVESHYFLKTGHMLSLSEQNIVDCSKSYGNKGCHGGFPEKTMQYIRDHGIYTENAYPYHGSDNWYCKLDGKLSNVTVKGFTSIPTGDEKKLQISLASHGPIAVTIDAKHHSFQHYKGGIWNEPNCGSSLYDLSHAVLLVGYGTDEYNVDYYILKNSWGTSWGEQGYFRMSRNHMNHCGIATRAVFPNI